MIIPNAQRAVVEIEKLVEYALNPDHPTGRHKARVFKAALGLTAEDSEMIRNRLLEVVQTHDAEKSEASPFGERYVIDFEVTTTKGSAVVRSAWIVRSDEDFPRLTSCYVL